MGGWPSFCCSTVQAALSGVALQAVAFRVEDLEEHGGGAVILKMDGEGAFRTAEQAASPQPWVMKILPGETASTSAPVAGASQSACCSQSLEGPLSGISKAKEEGRQIQDRGGMAA